MRVVEVVLLLCVLGIAGWLRFLSATETEVEVPIRNDASEYVSYAYNLDTYGVYSKVPTWSQENPRPPPPDAMRPPAYPELLRLFLHGAPDDAFVSRVVTAQAWLGMCTVLLGFFAARRVFGWKPALAVALLLAACPQFVIYESYLLTETLFTFVVTATTLVAVLALTSASRKATLAYAALFGALLGASALVRPTLQYLPPLLFLAALLLPRVVGRFRRPALLAVLFFAVTFAPWTIRNLEVTGHASDPRLAIATLQGGSYPDFLYDHDPSTYGGPSSSDPRSAEISSSMRAILAEIARKFRSDPGEYVRWYLVGKPLAFFSWEEVSGWGWVFIYPVLRSPFLHDPAVRAVSAIMTGLHYPLVICALMGMVILWTPAGRRAFESDSLRALRFVALMFAFVIALHVVGTPLPRYAVPFRLPMYLLSFSAILPLTQILAARMAHRRTPSTSVT